MSSVPYRRPHPLLGRAYPLSGLAHPLLGHTQTLVDFLTKPCKGIQVHQELKLRLFVEDVAEREARRALVNMHPACPRLGQVVAALFFHFLLSRRRVLCNDWPRGTVVATAVNAFGRLIPLRIRSATSRKKGASSISFGPRFFFGGTAAYAGEDTLAMAAANLSGP
jgi:hypothetical protein